MSNLKRSALAVSLLLAAALPAHAAELRLAAPAAGDQVVKRLVAANFSRATAALDRAPVSLSWALDPEQALDARPATFTQHSRTPGRTEVRGNEPRRLNQGTETVITATHVSKSPGWVDPSANQRTATTRTLTKDSKTPDRDQFTGGKDRRFAGRWKGVRTMTNDRKSGASGVATVKGDTATERRGSRRS